MSKSEVIRGLEAMQRRLKELDFIAVPAGPFLRNWREDFREAAIDLAPRWKGDVVDSIMSAQDTAKFPLWSRVFSDAPQARWSQYGTGLLSEDPDSAKQRYFPSIEGVREWAEDHGYTAYEVALGIYRRGGTPPTNFFSKAADAANSRMNERLGRFAGGIERQAGILP